MYNILHVFAYVIVKWEKPWEMFYQPLYREHVEDHSPAISCCFSNGRSWSWRRSLRRASASEDLSSVISSSCACRRTSIMEARSAKSALPSADASSEEETVKVCQDCRAHCPKYGWNELNKLIRSYRFHLINNTTSIKSQRGSLSSVLLSSNKVKV